MVKQAALKPLVSLLSAIGKTSRMSIFARKERVP
jgi:hypothetical protein